MSKDQPEYSQEHLSSQDQFMKISDYSQGKSSNHNNSQVDEYPFQELENVLSPDVEPRNKQAYKEKIGELQQKCARLFKTASFLTMRIEDLQIDSAEQTEAELDPNSVNDFLEEIQHELQKYKRDLSLYRQKQQITINSQRKQIQDLNVLVQSLQKDKQSLKQTLNDLQNINAELKNTNAQLLDDISLLETQLHELKSSKSYHRNHKSYSRSTFDDEIQAELQTMIEQLMAELQNERHSNKRAVTQMKRMQEQIIDLQRQIVAKNNRIYSLQMKELRSNRGLPRVQSKNEKITSPSNQKIVNYKSKAQRKIGRKDITLQQLLCQDREVGEKERYIIASKLLSFYIKKYELDDYEPLHADQLLLSNYNPTHPALITIRKPHHTVPYSGDLSPKILSWNLSVLLSKLLIEPTYESEYSDQNVKILTEAIDQFIQEEYPTFESCSSLKKLVDEMLKSLK